MASAGHLLILKLLLVLLLILGNLAAITTAAEDPPNSSLEIQFSIPSMRAMQYCRTAIRMFNNERCALSSDQQPLCTLSSTHYEIERAVMRILPGAFECIIDFIGELILPHLTVINREDLPVSVQFKLLVQFRPSPSIRLSDAKITPIRNNHA
ncbi:hypothetical protein AXF42_Ash015787 [Apostasia shenzhenica]|uniref:Uncharacterized protein n=1 Tax=Apostasia shenzhenica TaxID=1088818 RepID=A0A2H9ZXK5_9ASPA|nr:hypothetical protein AXF42_Ash015787 [Apostasia shenzhenica]